MVNRPLAGVRQSIADTWPHSLDASVARQDWNFSPWYDLAAWPTCASGWAQGSMRERSAHKKRDSHADPRIDACSGRSA